MEIARRFPSSDLSLVATRGTAAAIQAAGMKCKTVFKVNEGRPNAVDLLKAGSLQLVIYTATGAHSSPMKRSSAAPPSLTACRASPP